MAISASEIGVTLINALAKGGSISFPVPFIGLLDSSGNRISYSGYSNVKINTEGIKGNPIMGATGSEEGGLVAFIKSNTEENIYFPENKDGPAVTATGWGLFDDFDDTSPHLWGDLKEPISIGVGDVPIIRGGDLILKVK